MLRNKRLILCPDCLRYQFAEAKRDTAFHLCRTKDCDTQIPLAEYNVISLDTAVGEEISNLYFEWAELMSVRRSLKTSESDLNYQNTHYSHMANQKASMKLAINKNIKRRVKFEEKIEAIAKELEDDYNFTFEPLNKYILAIELREEKEVDFG